MKNSKVFALVTGALILGMAIGGLGIANAWSGTPQRPTNTMGPVATAPASTPATDATTPPSLVATMPAPPSVDATPGVNQPAHHAARRAAAKHQSARHHSARHHAAATSTMHHADAPHSEPAHHDAPDTHMSDDAHHAEGSGGCN